MNIRFLRCRLFGGIRSLHPAGLQSYSFQFLPPETLTLNVEHRGIIEDPVQGAQQRIILIEVASPVGGVLVAGENDIEVAFLVVSPVNQIEEQPGILFIELTQEGRTRPLSTEASLPARLAAVNLSRSSDILMK